MKEKVPFPAARSARQFTSDFYKLIGDLYTKKVNAILDPRNVQRLCHGISWRTHSGDEEAKKESTMQQHQLEHSVKFEDVVQHKLELIPATIQTIVTGMESELMRSLYATLSKSTEKSGNVVDAKQHGSMRAAFLEMLRKIEFGVDENGNVSLPEIHVGPGNPLQLELEKGGPAFKAQVDALIKEKSEAALKREDERTSKFKG